MGGKVDIVIPVFNQARLLEKCLLALDTTVTIPYTLWLVDDGSIEPALQNIYRAMATRPRTHVMRNAQNSGFASTCNKGARQGAARYICFLNTDVEMTGEWLDSMVAAMDNDPKVGICGPLLLFPTTSQDPARPAGMVQSCGFAYNVGRSPYHRLLGWSKDNPKVQAMREDLQGVTGACMLVRREVFAAVGGFHTDYVSTFEDAELGIRVKAAGYKVRFEPTAVGYHYTGASVVPGSVKFSLQRNAELFLQRNGRMVQYDEWRML